LGQSAVFLFVVFGLGLELSPVCFAVVTALLVLSNIALYVHGKERKEVSFSTLGLIIVGDVLLLTTLLWAYGGYMNPFSTMYLLQVILAAMLLDSRWTWFITALATVCYVALFWWYIPLAAISGGHHHHGEGQQFDLHLQGMLGSFLLLVVIISAFMQRMRAELERREVELERRRANEQKLGVITTIAASVAHELGTPLGSMALTLDDLKEEVLQTAAKPDAARQSIAVFESELARCADALARLNQSSGALYLDVYGEESVGNLVNTALERIEVSARACITVEGETAMRVRVPVDGFAHVVHALIKNAIEATDGIGTVELSYKAEGETLVVEVQDSGRGVPIEIRSRIGEPFFTTKSAGRGMGLGLFITKLFVERLGGTLSIVSGDAGAGTLVRFDLPEVVMMKGESR
jgi:two-component system sensor histidine kinase RegB